MAYKKIGVGIVGSGRMGRLRANLAAGDPRVRFLALSDADPAAAARLAGEIGADFHSGDNEAVISHPRSRPSSSPPPSTPTPRPSAGRSSWARRFWWKNLSISRSKKRTGY